MKDRKLTISISGLWLLGALFTIGFVNASGFWAIVKALLVWPALLGDAIRVLAGGAP